jgi:hypothetical protein
MVPEHSYITTLCQEGWGRINPTDATVKSSHRAFRIFTVILSYNIAHLL